MRAINHTCDFPSSFQYVSDATAHTQQATDYANFSLRIQSDLYAYMYVLRVYFHLLFDVAKKKKKRIDEANALARRAYVHRSEIFVTILPKKHNTRSTHSRNTRQTRIYKNQLSSIKRIDRVKRNP